MVALQKYRDKKIAIYGMGITGCSAAKTFKKLNAEVYCWDDNKKVRKKIINSQFLLNKFWLSKNTVDIIVLSPGIDVNKLKSLCLSSTIFFTLLSRFRASPKDAIAPASAATLILCGKI